METSVGKARTSREKRDCIRRERRERRGLIRLKLELNLRAGSAAAADLRQRDAPCARQARWCESGRTGVSEMTGPQESTSRHRTRAQLQPQEASSPMSGFSISKPDSASANLTYNLLILLLRKNWTIISIKVQLDYNFYYSRTGESEMLPAHWSIPHLLMGRLFINGPGPSCSRRKSHISMSKSSP